MDHRDLDLVFAFDTTTDALAAHLTAWFLANMPPEVGKQLAAVRLSIGAPPPGRETGEASVSLRFTFEAAHRKHSAGAYYLVGDRDLATFKAFVLPELTGSVVVHDRYHVYDCADLGELVHQLCCQHYADTVVMPISRRKSLLRTVPGSGDIGIIAAQGRRPATPAPPPEATAGPRSTPAKASCQPAVLTPSGAEPGRERTRGG